MGQSKLEGVLYVEATQETQADCLAVLGYRNSGAITMLTACYCSGDTTGLPVKSGEQHNTSAVASTIREEDSPLFHPFGAYIHT